MSEVTDEYVEKQIHGLEEDVKAVIEFAADHAEAGTRQFDMLCFGFVSLAKAMGFSRADIGELALRAFDAITDVQEERMN